MNYIEEENNKIIEELLKSNKVKPGQSIDYMYFLDLYKTYENRMKEQEFAELLGISYNSYNSLKRGQKVKVLKNKKIELTEKEKNKIIKELLESNKVRPEQSIDYTYFLDLYKPYKDKIDEVQFAGILDISHDCYNNLKRGRKAKVLKNKKIELTEEEKNKIIEELLESNKVKPEQLIDYTYFLSLYEPYKDKMKEVEFAYILDIRESNYRSLKRGEKVKVLKNKKEELTEEEKNKIIEELLKSNKVKPGQLIDYKYFLDLYEPYKDKMKEQEFAYILDIRDSNYSNIKYEGTKTKVLKDKKRELTKEEKNKIIEGLLENNKLRPGQLIDYTYFLSLYEPYKDKIDEVEFAYILDITDSNYKSFKYKGTKAKVLKNKKEELKEENNKIIEELLKSNKVKRGQLIDYAYFLDLYKPYKDKMKEQEFAGILGIKNGNYYNLKNKGTKAKVLKNKKEELIEEEKNKIIEELLESNKVKPGQLIDYEYFLDLYKPYKDKMKEVEFAYMLDIRESNYRSLKRGTKAKILKNKKEELKEEEKNKIIEELLKSNKVKPGQSIDYMYFLDLYKPYKDKMKEQKFAEILGIKNASYYNLKNKGKKAKVLKNKKEELKEEEKNKIIEELLKSNKVKPGQSIDYTYFLDLYKPYKDKMKEQEFARILDISYGSYNNFKRGRKAKVLKNKKEELKEEEKNKIIEELLKSNKVKRGQLIEYKYFLYLYEPYNNKMKEQEFAEILGIKNANYYNLKNKGRKVKVLKNKTGELKEEKKDKIIKELLKSGKVKLGQLIDYTYFLNLYEPYQNEMNEVEFAGILGISYNSYKSLKYLGIRLKVKDYRRYK